MKWTMLLLMLLFGAFQGAGDAWGQAAPPAPPSASPPSPPPAPPPPPPPPAAEPTLGRAPPAEALPPGRRLTRMPVSFSIVPLLRQGPVVVNLSLSFVLSAFTHLRGISLGSGISWISGTLRGAQLTGGLNYVADGGRGIQMTGGINIVGGDMRGFQNAGGLNLVLGSMRGAQASGGLNVTMGDFRGFQASGGLNITVGHLRGAQVSGGVNYAGSVRGLQASGGLNIAVGHLRGAQLTGGYNHAGSIRGAQIGVINYGGFVRGAQIGVINIAGEVRGTQLGILNIANKSKAPIGLLNVIKEGQRELVVWASDVTAANLGFKLGGRNLYTLLAAAVQPSRCKTRWMLGFGVGSHFRLPRRFFLDADVLVWHVNERGWTHELNLLGQVRVVAGYAIHRHFAVFAGITGNVAASHVNKNADLSFIGPRSLRTVGRRLELWAWPGFVAGFQI